MASDMNRRTVLGAAACGLCVTMLMPERWSESNGGRRHGNILHPREGTEGAEEELKRTGIFGDRIR